MAKLAVFPLRVFTTSGTLTSGSGFKLYGYKAGTSTPKDFYTDATGGTAYANPYTLPESGTVAVFLGDGAYKFDLQDASGTSQPGYPIDNVQGLDEEFQAPTIAALKALEAEATDYIYVGGYYSKGDGGQGWFYWDATNDNTENPDDGGSIIEVNSRPSEGAFKRFIGDVVDVKWFGAYGNGTSDDTTALQNAATVATGKTLSFPTGTYKTTGEITINGRVEFSNATITGTGSVRGVVWNDKIPHKLFKVKYNVDLASNRSSAVASGDLYIDPLLGDDSNDGTSSDAPLKTLAQLKTDLNTLIATGDTARTVIFRSGRYELSSSIDFDTALTSQTVTFQANYGEKPLVTSELLYFFRSGETATNTNSDDIYRLWCVDKDWKEVQIATTAPDDIGKVMNRNQNAQVGLTGSTLEIKPASAVYTEMAAATNLSKARLRVTQSFTSSVYYTGFNLDGLNLEYTLPTGQSSIYSNGYEGNPHGTPGGGGPQDGCPFVLEGLDSSRLANQWCNLGSTIELPDYGNVFASHKWSGVTFTISADRYTVKGVEFAYFAPTKANQELDFTGTAKQNGAGINISGANVTFSDNCYFHDFDGSCIVGPTDTNNLTVQDSKFKNIGHTAIGLLFDESPYSGSDTLTVTGCTFERFGNTVASGRGVAGRGTNYNIKYNTFFSHPGQAIQVSGDETASATLTYTIQYNRIYDGGVVGGEGDDRLKIRDFGAIYCNSLAKTAGAVCDVNIKNNSVYNIDGWGDAHGIYIDGGGNGTVTEQNLVFNVRDYCFDCRDVSSSTQDNITKWNVFFGSVRQQDNSGGQFTNNILIGINANKQNFYGGGTTITEPLSGRKLRGRAHKDYAELYEYEALRNLDLYDFRSFAIAPVLRCQLHTDETYEGTFDPKIEGTSTPGIYTPTQAYASYKVIGKFVYFQLFEECDYSSHSGTGNIRINLNDLPYKPEDATDPAEDLIGAVTIRMTNVPFTGQIVAYLVAGSLNITIQDLQPAGTTVALAIPASGTGSVAISGFFRGEPV